MDGMRSTNRWTEGQKQQATGDRQPATGNAKRRPLPVAGGPSPVACCFFRASFPLNQRQPRELLADGEDGEADPGEDERGDVVALGEIGHALPEEDEASADEEDGEHLEEVSAHQRPWARMVRRSAISPRAQTTPT